MSRLWGRTSAALLAGALAAGAATLAWSQQTPPAAPSSPPSATPAPPAARAEEPPPPAAEVPTVVAPGPTPEAPPQEISPAPSPPSENTASSSRPADNRPPPPPKRTLYNAAIIQAVDKVTAETLRFEVQVRQPVRYKGLIFTLHTCESAASGASPSAFAHLEIDSQPQPLPGRPPNPAKQVFKGWMVADAPGLHPLEHPVYDAWLIACKTGSAPTSSGRR